MGNVSTGFCILLITMSTFIIIQVINCQLHRKLINIFVCDLVHVILLPLLQVIHYFQSLLLFGTKVLIITLINVYLITWADYN